MLRFRALLTAAALLASAGIALVHHESQAQFTYFYSAAPAAGGGTGNCAGTGPIAFSNAQCSGGSCATSWITGNASDSWSYTASGSNRLLLVDVVVFDILPASVSALTYNGVSLTKLDSIIDTLESTAQNTETWYLIAPATGANTLAITLNNVPSYWQWGASSYTGVNQTTPFDTHTANQNNSASTTFSQNRTVPGGGSCWLRAMAWQRTGSATSAGAGTTKRTGDTVSSGWGAFDSGGVVGSGTQTLNFTAGSSTTWPGGTIATLRPAP